ncbi:50S ribosomal protein L21e [Candidatus Woesearchaeota archaeon]|nr:50S ribosomal protein L21e [Candidatus Woesearchaeota archaeon]
MVKRVGGFRRKTRNLLKKRVRQRGKISLSRYFAEFKKGDNVLFQAEPAVQEGMYHPRFHAKQGVVKKKRGSCYEVLIKDGSVEKLIIVHPIHLRGI